MRSVVSIDQDPFRSRKSTEVQKPLQIPDAESVREWVECRLKQVTGEDDEILVSLVLEEMKTGNLKVTLQSFLGKNTEIFVKDLEVFVQGLVDAQAAARKEADSLALLAAMKRKFTGRQRSGSPARGRSRSPRRPPHPS